LWDFKGGGKESRSPSFWSPRRKGSDALPLLQVTLARLYGEQEKRVLAFADYRGLDVAVSETAEAAMASLDAAAKAELAALVPSLVADVAAEPRAAT
jgi:hypothetical protein